MNAGALTKMVGPLPVAGWAAVIAGGVGVAYYVNRRASSAVSTIPAVDTSPASGTTVVDDAPWTQPVLIPAPTPAAPSAPAPAPVAAVPVQPAPTPAPALHVYTAQEVRDLFAQYGYVTDQQIASATWTVTTETGPDRIARIVRQLNTGAKTWAQVVKSVSELPHPSAPTGTTTTPVASAPPPTPGGTMLAVDPSGRVWHDTSIDPADSAQWTSDINRYRRENGLPPLDTSAYDVVRGADANGQHGSTQWAQLQNDLAAASAINAAPEIAFGGFYG